MTTASKTPNLGLMNPVGSDTFDITDFSNSMLIIDQNPGILTVANQASRPTGWNANQHGRRVMQADQGIEWWWNQPSSSVGGLWSRVSPKGWLAGTFHGGSVAGTTSAVTVASLSVLIPGGRPVQVFYSFLWATQTNISNGQIAVNYVENGSVITTHVHNGTGYNGGDPHNPPDSGMMYFLRNVAPTTQQTITFSISVQTLGGHPAGTSAIWDTTFDVYEV